MKERRKGGKSQVNRESRITLSGIPHGIHGPGAGKKGQEKRTKDKIPWNRKKAKNKGAAGDYSSKKPVSR